MSSGYLTSDNMTMIERILNGVRAEPVHAYAETSDARFLIAAFQQGLSRESDLQIAFDDYREAQRAGGKGPFWLEALKIFKVLHRTRPSTRPIAVPRAVDPVIRATQNRPQKVSDTIEARRRDDAIKSRNQMH